MKLERVAIQEFQQFAGRLEIAGLQPGLNVFSGGNEQGKSTIARAIRTAFIERHKVTTLTELRPTAKPSGNPLVEVDFKIGDEAYALKKQFFKPRCELVAGGKTLKEDTAEEFLSNLMGFTHSPKGATRPEHAGVPGLLWVAQNTAQNVAGAASNAASYLRDALAQLAGGNTSGGEDALIVAVQRELFQLVTDKKRSPTGVMLEAINGLNSLVSQRAELLRQREQYNADMESLSATDTEMARVAKDKPWEAFEQKIAAADAQMKAVAQLEQRLVQVQELLRSTGAELTLLLEQEAADALLDRKLEDVQQARTKAQGALDKADGVLAQATRDVEAAAQAHQQARTVSERAADAVAREYLVELLGMYTARLKDTTARIAQAQEVETEIEANRELLAVPGSERESAAIVEKIALLERLRLAYAPEGIVGLEQDHARDFRRGVELQARLDALPQPHEAVNLVEARQAEMLAADLLEKAQRVLTDARDARSTCAAAVLSQNAAQFALESQLQAPEFRSKRSARASAIVEKRAAVTGLTNQKEGVQQELTATHAKELTAEVDRLRAAANAARADQRTREGQVIMLRSRLETVGASGLDEQIARLDASVEQGERRVAELKLRANALTLLEKSLIEERDRAVELLRAPLTKRLEHYLKFLFADASVSLVEDLSPVAVTRGRQVEELGVLSVGAQEQMGILMRLAYADLLQEAGRPTLVMLDDIGAFADKTRRIALQAAINDAAKRHQILLFTCRPEDWTDIGVPPRSLEDMKAAA
jgi:hypothetical protein